MPARGKVGTAEAISVCARMCVCVCVCVVEVVGDSPLHSAGGHSHIFQNSSVGGCAASRGAASLCQRGERVSNALI